MSILRVGLIINDSDFFVEPRDWTRRGKARPATLAGDAGVQFTTHVKVSSERGPP